MRPTFSPSFPLGVTRSRGHPPRYSKHSRLPRARRPRPRTCLRKGCGRKYQPRRWNQRYCQDPECLRQVRRWQAARRQAKRRQDAASKPSMPRPRRSAGSEPRPRPRPLRTPKLRRAWSRSRKFFSPPFMRSARLPRTACDFASQPGTLSVAPPVGRPFAMSWIANVSGSSRGTLDGQKKRAYRVPSRTPAPVAAAAQHRR